MIDKLFAALKCSGAITIIILTVKAGRANSTEYVFSAPPEVDNKVVEEIPTQEEEYPFYECDEEALHGEDLEKNQESDDKIDSHECEEELTQEAEEQKQLSRNKHEK